MRALTATLVLLLLPAAAAGQSRTWTPEISAGIGIGHVFRFEDQTYGNKLNWSAGIALAHRSGVVLEVEGNQTRGLVPLEATCGVVGATCTGVGHYGPFQAGSVSAVVHYRFDRGRLQPYLLAGLGMMWSAWMHSTTYVTGSQAVVTETESRDRGIGPDLGAGLRFRLSQKMSVNPEIRWLEGSWGGRENLSVTRLTVRAVYAW